MTRIRKTKAQIEADRRAAAAEREQSAVVEIAQALELAPDNRHDAARLVLLTIQAGKVPGVTFTA